MPIRLLFGVIAVLLAAGAIEPARSASAPALARLLEAELARFPAHTGVYVKHLKNGELAGVRADERFNSASVIKIPVMVLAYRLADAGQLSLDDRVVLQRKDLRGGSGILRYHDLGLNPTWRDLITQMIITSDNTATDVLIGRVGGVARVNEFLEQASYPGLHLLQTTYELFRKRFELLDPGLKTLTPEDVYALQTGDLSFGRSGRATLERVQAGLREHPTTEEFDRRSGSDEAFWLGRITPQDTARMLESIERGTAASAGACREMVRALRGQQSGARRIPHFLEVPVGHKTGDIPPVVANDVGIVYGRNGPIVIAFLANAITGNYGEAEDRIGTISRLVVEYFDGRP
jgi:beta-lactamase class A